MLRLERLALAIAEAEGWHCPTSGSFPAGSCSYRHHNPGNLRASPFAVRQADGYAVFNSDADGFAALRWDLRQKATGNTRTKLNGASSLAQLGEVWAPSSDGNDPIAWTANVCAFGGFSADEPLKSFLE